VEGVVFGGEGPIHWLEPGIGDGSSTARFVRAIGEVYKGGFIVHGSDYQAESVEKAQITLEGLESRGVRVAEVIVRDAFSGGPLASEACDFALLSHFVYHVKNQLNGDQLSPEEVDDKMNRLVKGVMNSLKKDAMALAFHEGRESDMFGKLGQAYGSAMNDAPDRIVKAARLHGKAVVSMGLESRLYFPDLPMATIESFESLDNWKRCEEGSPEASWLKKFLFALHNTPVRDADGILVREGGVKDLAREPGRGRNSTRLTDAIAFLHGLLTTNASRAGDGPHLLIRSEMQALLNDQALEAPVRAAFAQVAERLPEIRARTTDAMLAAGRMTQPPGG
jgi:hypothetical protein